VALSGWQQPDTGVLFVISGPSGVGKSTLISYAMQTLSGLYFSVSATTRAPRAGEQDGRDYHFMQREQFDAQVAAGAFLEHATVYDRSYGTLLAPTQAALAQGDSLILDIDVQGAAQVRQRLPEAVTVFILPPSLDQLESRLRSRSTDSDEVIASRMAQVSQQVSACGQFDFLVMNEDLPTAQQTLLGILMAQMSRRGHRESWVRNMQDQVAGSGRERNRG